MAALKKHTLPLSLKIILLSFFGMIALAQATFAQEQKSKMTMAERAFDSYNFSLAADIYTDVLKKDPNHVEALRKAGLCQIKMGLHSNAVAYYKRLTTLDGSTPEDLLQLAEVLKMDRDYEAAHAAYVRYLRLKPESKYAKRFVDNPQWADIIIRDSLLLEITNSKVNSDKSDFAPTLLGTSVLFSSSRGTDKAFERTYAWNNQAYLNMYLSNVNKDNSLDQVKLVEEGLNTRYHEGTAVFDSTRKVMYLTRNNYRKGKKKRDDGGVLNLAMYYGPYDGTSWGELEEFPYNDPNYSVGHPAIAKNGNTLYFVSDMPGGKGGTDIYRCNRVGTSWSEPENLEHINTPLNEMFPYMYGNDTLFFSSEGHIGLGGLDIFYTSINDTLAEIKNMGYPANSAYDDFGAIVRQGQMLGYFCSNRPGGRGDDDIYEYRISKPDSILIEGTVVDELTGLPLSNALVYQRLPGEQGKFELIAVANEQGKYFAKVGFDDSITLVGSLDGYFQDEIVLSPTLRTTIIEEADLTLKKFDFMSEGLVYYADTRAPAEGATVSLMSAKGTLLDSIVTGPDGRYSFPLTKDQTYKLVCKKADFADRSTAIDTRQRTQGTVIISDFELFKLEVGVTVKLDNIYYDLAKWNIRTDAAQELNKLVQLMNDNNQMSIELSSHTDARGRNAYNQDLSEKRAESAREYVVSQGIDPSRITYKGYGESKPVNRCVDGVKCSEEEYQENRRTEFTITGLGD